jgi:hypothetical protein
MHYRFPWTSMERTKEGEMNTAGFHEGEVLWIDYTVRQVPELPNGFAFLVQDFLGWADPGRAVWLRGTVIGGLGGLLTLCVPTNQPRAVPTTRVPADTSPMRTGGVAAVEDGSPRNSDDPWLVGPPPGYERQHFDNAQARKGRSAA